MFTLPEDLPTGVEELASLLHDAEAEFDQINASFAEDGVPEEAQLARLAELNDAASRLTAAHAVAVEAANAKSRAERKASADALAAARTAARNAAKPAVEVVEDQTVTAAVETPEVEAPAEVIEAPSFKGVGKESGRVIANTAPKADIGFQIQRGAPGYSDYNGLVGYREMSLIIDRMAGNTSPSASGSVSLATLDRGFAEEHRVDTAEALVAAIEDQVRDQNWNPAKFDSEGALTAAAGWCAPSETIYTFCDIAPASDLVSLPSVNMTRGGLRWPNEPDFTGLYAALDEFDYTEAELLTDPTKPCVEVPCPTMTEIRPEAIGLCITAGILQKRGWPELIERFLKEALKAHQHRISQKSIAKIVAGSTAVNYGTALTTIGANSSVLNGLELQATNQRLADRRPYNAPMEGIAPTWLRSVFRADLAMQQGLDVKDVSDADVDRWLSRRGIRLQYVSDWQTRAAGLPGESAVLPVAWPATVSVVLYAPGTWFRHLDNVIEMGMLYDKAQLQANRYTQLFTEDEIFVASRCWSSVVATFPLCISGAVGSREVVTCNAAAPGTAV